MAEHRISHCSAVLQALRQVLNRMTSGWRLLRSHHPHHPHIPLISTMYVSSQKKALSPKMDTPQRKFHIFIPILTHCCELIEKYTTIIIQLFMVLISNCCGFRITVKPCCWFTKKTQLSISSHFCGLKFPAGFRTTHPPKLSLSLRNYYILTQSLPPITKPPNNKN